MMAVTARPAGTREAVDPRSALRCCDEVGARSVAFPSISTGAYRFPLAQGCRISVAALRAADSGVERCLLVAFDDRTERNWARALDAG